MGCLRVAPPGEYVYIVDSTQWLAQWHASGSILFTFIQAWKQTLTGGVPS